MAQLPIHFSRKIQFEFICMYGHLYALSTHLLFNFESISRRSPFKNNFQNPDADLEKNTNQRMIIVNM